MERNDSVKQAVADLMDNLGTIGLFMLGEARVFLRKSWGASKEEFMEAVDQTARKMKQSSQLAAEDIERTADRIKQSWELLDKEKNLDWDNFFKEVTTRLESAGQISRDTFEICVNQAKETLDKQWTAIGRIGEEQLDFVHKQTEQMAETMKGQWGAFWDNMEKTGKRIDRAMEAAWEEFKKKD